MKVHDDVLIGSVLVILSLILLIWVIPAQIPAPVDETAMPPSLMANLSMSLVLTLSILLIISGLRKTQNPAKTLLTRKNAQWLGFVVLSLGISGLLIHTLGFFLGGMIVVAGYMFKMGERQPVILTTLAVGAAGICYLAIRFSG